MTTGKNIALARWTFVDKVMSLLFDPHYYFFIVLCILISLKILSQEGIHRIHQTSKGFTAQNR